MRVLNLKDFYDKMAVSKFSYALSSRLSQLLAIIGIPETTNPTTTLCQYFAGIKNLTAARVIPVPITTDSAVLSLAKARPVCVLRNFAYINVIMPRTRNTRVCRMMVYRTFHLIIFL